MIVRSETPGDIAAIRLVEEVAFGRSAEAQLVDDLRAAGDSVYSLVAVDDGTVVGHALFSRMKAPFPALALAPVAVLPEYRRTGFASRLIRQGITRSETAGWLGIFVLGDPAFYRRFGFDVGKASGFFSPYAGPHLMVLPLGKKELPTDTGIIAHAPAFAKLG
ncbi:GNAT family N-acetyltransferase [Bradyrhizobium retamae]|uniref:GCN5 family acetyltransferase n=1 Tax=Bradyrhizobium retamae TaxID=1300035 RepID=A0A0R3NDV6_9BRAD|nr:N-acetyltransferase [Bradyrhizobium retamae]KRR30353.1 GCN5 family acetyltransferase [Bradyrhizobium retamae]